MWERKKNIIVSDHQIFWVSHSPASLDKCNRTSCNCRAVSLTSTFFPYNINSEVGKKVAVESCLGTPLHLNPLLHQEREVSHLLGWLTTSVLRCVDRLWCPPGQGREFRGEVSWGRLEKLMLFSWAFCLAEELLASEGGWSYESSLELSWKRPRMGLSVPPVFPLTHSLKTHLPSLSFFVLLCQ